MDFKELSKDEVSLVLPMIDVSELIGAYAMAMGKETVAMAVFLPSAVSRAEAALCYLELPAEEEQRAMMPRFFDSCFQSLKKKDVISVYYRSSGSYEELNDRFDLLISAGFEPKVYIGDILTGALPDYLGSSFFQEFSEDSDAPRAMTLELGIPESYLPIYDKCMENQVIGNQYYSEQFSYIYAEDDQTGGILGVIYDPSGPAVFTTGVQIFAENQAKRKKVIQTLVGSLLEGCKGALTENTQIALIFDEHADVKELERMFKNGIELEHYQEFLYE